MDDKTLNSLNQIFQINPSSDLAQLLALQYVQRGELQQLNRFFPHLVCVIPGEDGAQLGQAAIEIGAFGAALAWLSSDEPSHQILRVRCLLGMDDTASAQLLYKALIEAHPQFEAADLNRRLKMVSTNEPMRLRVIEKPEPAEVIDLLKRRPDSCDFASVVGLDEVKKQIHKKIILPFQKPSLFQRFKKKVGGGILLYGPPGCGKTLLARATAGECKASFFNIEIADVLDMYIGASEQNIHAIFEKARNQTPSVIFFDEIEALAGKREHSRNSAQANTVSQFLTELDGFAQNNSGVLILGSTNVPWALDAAFLRPGRFDRLFFVPPPDKTARRGILEHHMKERPNQGDILFEQLAAKTSGFSGADLANLVEMAADEAIDETLLTGKETAIAMRHFTQALKDSRSSTTEWLTTARNYARYANDGGRYDEVLDFINKHGK